MPLLDEDDPRDAEVLDDFVTAFGGMDFVAPLPVLARPVRGLRAPPAVIEERLGWARRFAARAGGVRALVRDRPRAITYVMHAFMDADKVKPAWELLQRGEMSDEPAIRETQERLQACSYAMAHPESGELVPACAQHSVLDPAENLRLTEELPLMELPMARA